MNKNAAMTTISIITALILITILLYLTKLDVTIPAIKVKFISPDTSTQQIQYSYSYQGTDIIRGGKFGGHGYSDILTVKTGETVEIPSKKITSFWPFSKFTYILINGDTLKTEDGYCTYTAGIWDDTFKEILNQDVKNKEELTGYIYLPNKSNEYILGDTKDKVIEIKCL